MPRVISTALRDRRIPGRRARQAYLDARSSLLEAFDECCTDSAILGWYGHAFRILRSIPLLRRFSFAIWASDLRQNSWFTAEQLLISPNTQRDQAELWDEIQRKLEHAAKRKNPLYWITVLGPPSLLGPKDRPDILDVVEFVADAGYDSDHRLGKEDNPDEHDWENGGQALQEGPRKTL